MSDSTSKYTRQTVLARTEWLPGKLFSLRVTRPEGYHFQAGQFARLGLAAADAADDEPTIWRAYSMVNGPADDWLEFYSVVVPDGEFSPRLLSLDVGDTLCVDKTAFGFLTLDRFEPAQDLWLIGSGTGLSAYLSILRDPATWQHYERVFLVHGVRTADELAYREQILDWANQPDMAGQLRPEQLIYLPIATREALPGRPQARLTTLLADGGLEATAGATLDPEQSRIMLCGNPGIGHHAGITAQHDAGLLGIKRGTCCSLEAAVG